MTFDLRNESLQHRKRGQVRRKVLRTGRLADCRIDIQKDWSLTGLESWMAKTAPWADRWSYINIEDWATLTFDCTMKPPTWFFGSAKKTSNAKNMNNLDSQLDWYSTFGQNNLALSNENLQHRKHGQIQLYAEFMRIHQSWIATPTRPD